MCTTYYLRVNVRLHLIAHTHTDTRVWAGGTRTMDLHEHVDAQLGDSAHCSVR